MKIGYLLQAGVPEIMGKCPSGAANHVLQVCKGLMRRGHRVRVLVHLHGQIWKTDDLTQYEPVPVPALDRGVGRFLEKVVRRTQSELNLPYFALFDSLRFAIACCKELTGYDVLYERMGWMGGGGSFAARVMRIPHLLELNGDHLAEHAMLGFAPGRLQRLASRFVMRTIARGAAHTIATGEGWRLRHIERWGVPNSKVSVIQNGSEVVDLLRRDDLRCFGAEPIRSPLELIYVGGFEPWQNLPLLLRAVSKALSSGSKVRLTLAGAGTVADELEKLRSDLNLEAHVRFAGHVAMDQLIVLLREAQVGLSLYEGREEFTGLKLLDYKSAGLATIATGRNGQPSLIKHGLTGLIIPPGDLDALLGAICQLEQDPEIASRFGRHARLEAEQQHRWQCTVECIEQRLSDVVKAYSTRHSEMVLGA